MGVVGERRVVSGRLRKTTPGIRSLRGSVVLGEVVTQLGVRTSSTQKKEKRERKETRRSPSLLQTSGVKEKGEALNSLVVRRRIG